MNGITAEVPRKARPVANYISGLLSISNPGIDKIFGDHSITTGHSFWEGSETLLHQKNSYCKGLALEHIGIVRHKYSEDVTFFKDYLLNEGFIELLLLPFDRHLRTCCLPGLMFLFLNHRIHTAAAPICIVFPKLHVELTISNSLEWFFLFCKVMVDWNLLMKNEMQWMWRTVRVMML